MIRFGICFSRDFKGHEPLGHIGTKLPVYLQLLELCQKEGWEVYVLTRKTYEYDSTFNGAWLFANSRFKQIKKPVKIDIVYDRTGGVMFPPEEDPMMKVVNRRDFKIMCWDKWLGYAEIGEYMPKTFWLGEKKNLSKVLPLVKTDWVVLKPFNGLKGMGIFIGPKEKAQSAEFMGKNPKYIAQEFLDTSKGIPGITEGLHDLRIAVVNGKVVWSHVRIPLKGTYTANAARGGDLREVSYERQVPESVKKIVNAVKIRFSKKYDNPTYSLDFGIDKNGIPKIFEINDQIGFPRWEMKAREIFLKELVESFKQKL